MLEIRHLRLIKLIVEQGSMVNAVDKLYLTPSALSHQLKEAELQLGVKIFYRLNKRFILTPVGEKVYKSAVLILEELTKVKGEVNDLISGKSGTIRICTECYTSYHWLPAVLKRFSAKCPQIEVKIVFEAMSKPIQKLMLGEVDLVITNDRLPNDNIEFIELFKDEMTAVVPIDHSWAAKPFIDANDFEHVNLIIHSEPLETVFVYKNLLQPNGKQAKNITILPLTEAAIEMVKADMGVMVLPKWAVKPYLHTGELMSKKLTDSGLYKHQYVALVKNDEYADYMEFFIHFLREAMSVEI